MFHQSLINFGLKSEVRGEQSIQIGLQEMVKLLRYQ